MEFVIQAKLANLVIQASIDSGSYMIFYMIQLTPYDVPTTCNPMVGVSWRTFDVVMFTADFSK